MPVLGEVLSLLDRHFPPATAEGWDAVGLTCGNRGEVVHRVLLAVDCVPATVAQAESLGAQLLLTHHPLLLTGVHGVPAEDPKGGLVHRMIRGGIAHYVAHTNADIAREGVSQALADALSLRETRPLAPDPADPRVGGGRIGRLPAPVSLAQFSRLVAETLPRTVWGVRTAGHPEQQVATVAVCGGAGAGYAGQARALGADVFLTSDVKHHNALEIVVERTSSTHAGEAPMAVLDAAHWATEWPWLVRAERLLVAAFGATLATTVSELRTDPWTLHAP